MREHRSISIADQIFEKLQRDILSGKYERGEVLVEQRLAEELGVSRTPVREAMRRLEQERILEEGTKGAVVVGISREDMLDMYEIRLAIEGIAAERAALYITDEQLSKMRDILDLLQFYTEKEDAASSDKIKDLDSDFHLLLYKSSGSRALCDTLNGIHKKMIKYRKASISNQIGRASCRERV